MKFLVVVSLFLVTAVHWSEANHNKNVVVDNITALALIRTWSWNLCLVPEKCFKTHHHNNAWRSKKYSDILANNLSNFAIYPLPYELSIQQEHQHSEEERNSESELERASNTTAPVCLLSASSHGGRVSSNKTKPTPRSRVRYLVPWYNYDITINNTLLSDSNQPELNDDNCDLLLSYNRSCIGPCMDDQMIYQDNLESLDDLRRLLDENLPTVLPRDQYDNDTTRLYIGLCLEDCDVIPQSILKPEDLSCSINQNQLVMPESNEMNVAPSVKIGPMVLSFHDVTKKTKFDVSDVCPCRFLLEEFEEIQLKDNENGAAIETSLALFRLDSASDEMCFLSNSTNLMLLNDWCSIEEHLVPII